MSGILMAAQRSAAAAGGTAAVSISPASQSKNFTTTSAVPVTRVFSTESVTVTGGTPTSYNWYFTGTSGGVWAIASGQGTASCAASITDDADTVGSATLKCDVVINGVTYTVLAGLSYWIEFIDRSGGIDLR